MVEEKQTAINLRKLFERVTSLSFLSFLFGIWGIYLAYESSKEAKPVYSIYSNDILVNAQSDNRIKVYFDSIRVSNVRIAKIILWNAGNDFLDKDQITNNIIIKSIYPTNILEVRQVKITRDNLIIKSTIDGADEGDYINCSLIGDDGLESDDGFQLNIVYTSPVNTDWSVQARIKKIPTGFVKVKINSENPLLSTIKLIPLILLFIIIYLVSSIIRKQGGLKQYWRRTTSMDIFVFVVGCLFLFFLTYSYVSDFFTLLTSYGIPDKIKP